MSRHVVEVVQCDVCGMSNSENEEIVVFGYGYRGRFFEIDLCPEHYKETEAKFEELSMSSRRVQAEDVAPRRRRISRGTKPSKAATLPDGSKKFDQWKVESDGEERWVCPWAGCRREFSAPHALSVHHTRTHNVVL